MKAQLPRACPRKIPALGRGSAASAACLLRCLILALGGALMSPGPLLAGVEVGRILVKNGTLFTLQAGETHPQRGFLLAGEDGKILRVGYGEPPPGIRAEQVVDATGKMVIPGFVSAHSHLYQAVLRGLAVDKPLGDWVDEVKRYSTKAPPSDRYYATLYGCYDFLRHGITTAFNFNDANGEPELDAEALNAELASGMRFVHGYCLPMRGTREGRLRDFESFYSYSRAFAGKRTTFLALALGGYACFNNDRDYIMLEGEIMAKYGLFNQAHYLEPADPAQVQAQRSKFGLFAESGELGPRLSFGHLVHADDAILSRIAAAGAGMVWNPLSNGRLGSGAPDIPKIRRLGIRVGMGVDGQASADIADPFENMRSGLYSMRARYEDAAILTAPRRPRVPHAGRRGRDRRFRAGRQPREGKIRRLPHHRPAPDGDRARVRPVRHARPGLRNAEHRAGVRGREARRRERGQHQSRFRPRLRRGECEDGKAQGGRLGAGLEVGPWARRAALTLSGAFGRPSVSSQSPAGNTG